MNGIQKKGNLNIVPHIPGYIDILDQAQDLIKNMALAELHFTAAERLHAEAACHFHAGDPEAAFQSMVKAYEQKALGNKIQQV